MEKTAISSHLLSQRGRQLAALERTEFDVQRCHGVHDKDRDRRLRHAAWRGDVALAKRMLKAGADVEQMDADHFTPVMIASRWGQLDIVRLLVKRGARLVRSSPPASLSAPCPLPLRSLPRSCFCPAMPTPTGAVKY
jgi:ankyrin repeat protein